MLDSIINTVQKLPEDMKSYFGIAVIMLIAKDFHVSKRSQTAEGYVAPKIHKHIIRCDELNVLEISTENTYIPTTDLKLS